MYLVVVIIIIIVVLLLILVVVIVVVVAVNAPDFFHVIFYVLQEHVNEKGCDRIKLPCCQQLLI
jgi:hypothetical protein